MIPIPKSIDWIEKQNLTPNFTFHKIGIVDFDGTAQFHPPNNPNYVSHSIINSSSNLDNFIEVPVKCINTILKQLKIDAIEIMKMDIEGANMTLS